MGGLDDVSKAIGRLEEGHESAQRQRANLFVKMEEVQKTLAELGPVVERVAQHEEQISSLIAFRNRLLGVAAALGSGCGLVAAWLKDHFEMTGGAQ